MLASRKRGKIIFTHATASSQQGGGPLDGSGCVTDQGFAMTSAPSDGQATADRDLHRALLDVSEAIVSHRDLSALFHDLAGRLRQVVRFDYLALLLHEVVSNTLRQYVLELHDPALVAPGGSFPVGEVPAGLAWQTLQPLILTNVAELRRWPRFLEWVKPRPEWTWRDSSASRFSGPGHRCNSGSVIPLCVWCAKASWHNRNTHSATSP
jgi:hypothetical protein